MEELKSKKVMGAINLRTQKRKVENTKAVLEEKKSSLFDDVENSSIIEEKLGSYTEEQVGKMTKEELYELDKFIVDNGLVISLPEGLEGSVSDEEYKRDMYKFLVATINAEKEIDRCLEEFDIELANMDEEIKQIMSEYDNSLVNIMRDEIKNNPAFKNNPKFEAYCNQILKSFDNALDLEPVIKQCSQLKNPDNTINDLKRNFESIYKQYQRALDKLNVKHDLSQFGGFERIVLDEKYHGHENLLVFILMKFIAKRAGSLTFKKEIDGVFASQICTNIYLAMNDEMDKEHRDIFVNSCERLLDIFVG